MQLIIESLKNLNESDFFKKVNLHIHTNLSDGILTPEEVIRKAKDTNLKLISITDHNTVEAYKNNNYSNIDGLTIITGVEFDCWYKLNLLHILGYGIDINNESINNICAKNLKGTKTDFVRFFNRRKAKDVINAIKKANGIAVLAHPACCWSFNLKKMVKELKLFGLDGIEVYYPYIGHRKIIKFYSISQIRKIADELELLTTGGTDCHGMDLSGR